ncbi:MAG TPA: hypothetical protein VM308_00725 [Sphingomicrobium sp.]|nr:hypothetical protein [Sphingomicrobium sp.]
MRKTLMFAAAAAMSGAAVAASADYYLKIEGVSRPSAAGPIYLKVVGAGDVDGDGIAEQGIVRLNCAGGEVRAAHFQSSVTSPRDAASGQASGKRTHHPVTFVKEWGPSTPQFRELKTGWDIKKNEGARMVADAGGWTSISVEDNPGLCAAAEEAAKVKATKSRSNIQNN